MKYTCINCNYTFDDSVWDIEEWIEPWTKFHDLWDDFHCPVCYEESDSFHEIHEEVNYIEDDDRLDLFETEHMPIVSFDGDVLKVSVWKQPHPMWEEHRISSISLYDEYGDLVEESFLLADDEPICEFDASDLDDFEIRVNCTIHGIWWMKIIRED